jgi:MATE family multidrug resistance protein
MLSVAAIRSELRPMLKLALPLIVAELGWMGMEIVDTIMVSRLPNSAEAIGAAGLGGILFYVAAIFCAGLLFGLDTVVSQSFGAGRLDDCHRWLIQSLYIVAALAPLCLAAIGAMPWALRRAGTLDPHLLQQTTAFMHALMWSAVGLLLYFAFRRYLQAINHVQVVMFALLSVNVINLIGNWALIYGHLGLPALGIAGSGWSTVIARSWMAAVLFGYIVYYDRKHHVSILELMVKEHAARVDFARIRRLLSLGAPVAFQILAEVGVFAAATYLAGRLGVVPLAAHQITLRTASVTFMVPLAISSAAAVRVGQALGRGDLPGASRAGWTALALGSAFMTCAAIAFVAVPRAIARVFTTDEAVIQTTIVLLFVAAVFQLFDGLQIVASGALRGAGDTRTPMLTGLGAYWLVGLPLGYYLAFHAGMGVVGVWTGLAAALFVIGVGLLWWWGRKMRALAVR